MMSKATAAFERVEMMIDGKSLDLGFGSGTSDPSIRDEMFRTTNMWPVPSTGNRGFGGGGAFGSGFGGGFGASSGTETGFPRSSGFGSGDADSRAFGTTSRRSSLWQTSSAMAHSTTSDADKDRSLLSPTSESPDTHSQYRGFFGSSSRLSSGRGRRSSSKRSKPGRRKSGRRGGSERPGHCFNCGEHGHISKMCPKKMENAPTDEARAAGDSNFGGNNFGWNSMTDRLKSPENRMSSDQYATKFMKMKDRNALDIDDEKLEAQKARLSYYGCSVSNDFDSPKILSPEVDKFSEQLDNALKLSPSVNGERPRTFETPTRVHEKVMTGSTGRGGAFPAAAKSPTPAKTPEPKTVKALDEIEKKVVLSDLMTIETRRTVKRDGEPFSEEWTVVTFPRVLPDNVRVITAQFVPAPPQRA